MNTKLEMLRRLPFLRELSDDELASLLPSVGDRTFAARSFIFRAGEDPQALCILLSGRVQVMLEDERGRSFIISTLHPQDFFGEMCLIEGGRYVASGRAIEQCSAICIPARALLAVLRSPAALALLRLTLVRLDKAHRQIAILALSTVYQRVAAMLLEHGMESAGEWHVRIGSEQLAMTVGASREMVSRVLRAMIDSGLVRRQKRKIIVIDRQRLQQVGASLNARKSSDEAGTTNRLALAVRKNGSTPRAHRRVKQSRGGLN